MLGLGWAELGWAEQSWARLSWRCIGMYIGLQSRMFQRLPRDMSDDKIHAFFLSPLASQTGSHQYQSLVPPSSQLTAVCGSAAAECALCAYGLLITPTQRVGVLCTMYEGQFFKEHLPEPWEEKSGNREVHPHTSEHWV